MKSDRWLTERIINESVHKPDISYIRLLLGQGKSDEQVLAILRKRMLENSRGMREFIRHEKIRALMVKLSSGIHWVLLLSVIKSWITEKEAIIRWRECAHAEKIQGKVRTLKNKLIDAEYQKIKFDCANGEELPERVMLMLEEAAEELLLKIEEEDSVRTHSDTADPHPAVPASAATRQGSAAYASEKQQTEKKNGECLVGSFTVSGNAIRSGRLSQGTS